MRDVGHFSIFPPNYSRKSMSNANSTNPKEAPVSSPEGRSSVFDHPIGFWFFFWGEFAERCCYYGMRGILLLYMIQILGFDDGKASMVMSYFISACYLLPLLGGYVADNFFGKYRTIVYFSIPYILGQALLGISALHNETCLYLSLGLLAMGSGVIKPNISTLMGMTYDQKCAGKSKMRSDAFAMFYGAINIGAFISGLCVPAIRNYFGGSSQAYAIAFLFPAVLMILAFIVFALGKPFYAVEKIERKVLTAEEAAQRWILLRRLFGLFLIVTIFWSVFDQSVTTWTLFARDYLHLELFGVSLSPDQLQAVNPLLIVLLLPPVTLFWHFLANRKINLRPTSKMLIGFCLTFVTMFIASCAGFLGSNAVVRGGPQVVESVEITVKNTLAMQSNEARSSAETVIAGELAQVALKAAVTESLKDDPDQFAAVVSACREFRSPSDSDDRTADQLKKVNAGEIEMVTQALTALHPEAKKLLDAAKSASESAKDSLKKHVPAEVALAAAAIAAQASSQGAKAALAAGQTDDGETDAANRKKAIEEVRRTAVLTEAAVNAVKASVKAASAPADAQNDTPKKNDKIDLSACSSAANRATASASAARKAIDSLKHKEPQVVLQHASIAVLASADATVITARASAKATDREPAEDVLKTEIAAANGRISIWWQLIPYLIITISEICISVVGLELAFAVAPASMKSFVTACWLLTVFLAGILNAQVTPFYNHYVSWFGITLTPGIFFGIFAVVMVPLTLTFIVVSKRFNVAVDKKTDS
jgi:POT family proton-dependent oligopeptide transporter